MSPPHKVCAEPSVTSSFHFHFSIDYITAKTSKTFKSFFQNQLELTCWASANQSCAIGRSPSRLSHGSPGFLLMLPPQAGTSRCCLDFLFPLRCGRRATSSSFPPFIPSSLPGQQVGRILFCLQSSGVFKKHQAAWKDFFWVAIIAMSYWLQCNRSGQNSIYPPFVSLTQWLWLLSCTSGHPPLWVTGEFHLHLMKNETTCCCLAPARRMKTAGVLSDTNTSWEVAHSNIVTNSHYGETDELFLSGSKSLGPWTKFIVLEKHVLIRFDCGITTSIRL